MKIITNRYDKREINIKFDYFGIYKSLGRTVTIQHSFLHVCINVLSHICSRIYIYRKEN